MKKTITLLLLVLSSLILACGGGGGGSTGGGSGGIAYTGPTTPAVITNTNAEVIAEGAFSGGTTASGFALSATSEANPPAASPYAGSQSLYSLSKAFSESASKISVTTKARNASERFAPVLTSTDSGTINGGCGGSAKYNLKVNDQTGNFTGSFLFSNYCDAGTTINGSTTVSGTIDLVSQTIITIKYTFNNIQSSDVVLHGTVNVDDSGYPPNSTTTFNMLAKNISTSKVYKYDNYVLSGTEGQTDIAFDMTGTFYDPDYGYVTVSTPVDFVVGMNDDWPSSGEMLCVGANAGQTKLTAVNITTYKVSVDPNGDSTFETEFGPHNWSDL